MLYRLVVNTPGRTERCSSPRRCGLPEGRESGRKLRLHGKLAADRAVEVFTTGDDVSSALLALGEMAKIRLKTMLVLGALALLTLVPVPFAEVGTALGGSVPSTIIPCLTVLFVLRRAARSEKTEERRFWLLLAISFTGWVIAEAALAVLPETGAFADVVADLTYLASFLFIALASEQNPHLADGWSRGDSGIRYSLLGSLLFFVGFGAYFAIAPSGLNADVYQTFTATFAGFAALDALVAVRFFSLWRSCSVDRWRTTYGTLALAAGVWLVFDLIDGLLWAGLIETSTPPVFDLVFYFSLVGVCWTALLPELRPGAETSPQEPAWTIGLLLMYAFLVPVLHFGMYVLQLVQFHPGGAREIVALSLFVGMLGLAALQHQSLTQRNTELRSHVRTLRLNEKQIQSQKMEALGRLCGGIAHDFNNLLTIIRGYAELIRSDPGSTDEIREHTEKVTGAVERATRLSTQLMTFGRSSSAHSERVGLGSELAHVEGMLQRVIGDDVRIRTSIADNLWTVRADSGKFSQILVNLALNARAAMPRGGVLSIELANISLSGSDGSAEPGDYVRLVVSDTGGGMDNEILARVFEPYFTTRDDGVGLGLTTVYGIVKQFKGHVRVESKPGRGARFELFFPRDDEPPSEVEPEVVLTPAPRLGVAETVLVVEDDDAVRKLAIRSLENQGYRVLSASNGHRALELFSDHPGPIDVLLTDVMMPGMSGGEVAQHVARLRPETRIVFMSGYPQETLMKRAEINRETQVIQKPFSPDVLGRQIRGALDSTA